jgi:hypothetical protein
MMVGLFQDCSALRKLKTHCKLDPQFGGASKKLPLSEAIDGASRSVCK